MHKTGWSITGESGIMTLTKGPEHLREECIYGIQRLLPLLEAFSQEIDGVKTDHDIEHIHRMRVASRRLRAALPLFVSCIPEKKYRQWMLEIQRITRALGDARDTDVQIAYIARLIKKRANGKRANNQAVSTLTVSEGDVETILLLQLQKKRSKLQAVVVSALERLEKSGIIGEMRIFFQDQTDVTRRTRKKLHPWGIPPVAAERISLRLNGLLAYEPWVHNPDAVAQHHAMRIAAKKLRYTIEVYAPLYRLGLKKFHIRIKKIQEILGDMHDCDVWIDTVMGMILKERSTFRNESASRHQQVSLMSGYRHFLSERETERKKLHRRYVRYWNSLVRARIWDELKRTLTEGRKRKFRLPLIRSEDAVRSSISTLANQFSEGIGHSHKVTALALMIFDDLAHLHRLGAHGRFLLQCACSLHDIGWKYGQKGHAKNSAIMILSDENLLLDVIDRGIIAMVSEAHRGKVHVDSDGMYSLLKPEERDTVMMLSSLIRIADGLDYSHSGSIDTAHCTIYPDEVMIEISAIQDASAEIDRARQKGDLFTQVFNRRLVIG
jgi:CHAD domain-containing protein